MKSSKTKFFITRQVFSPYRWLHYPDEIQGRVYICHSSYNLQPEPVSLYCKRRVHRPCGPTPRLSCSVMDHSPIHQRELDIHLSLKVCLQNVAASSGAFVWWMLYSNAPCFRMRRMMDTQCL